MKVFFTNYHISVNDCFVSDLSALGHEIIMPTVKFAMDGVDTRIHFFAPNDEHFSTPGVIPVDYEQFLYIPENIVLVLSCSQMYDDMIRLYKARGSRDTFVLLSSQPGLGEWVEEKPDWPGSDYLISHSLVFHRKSNAKYKILYFNRPKKLVPSKNPDAFHRSFKEKKIKLYINHFDKRSDRPENGTFSREKQAAEKFRELWEKAYGWKIPFYGVENKDGQLSMQEAQNSMYDSMFTLAFKGHETWGQMVNESMLIGTPCIFLEDFITDMFTQYLITPDTAVIGKTVEEIFEKINNMSVENYETLCNEAMSASEMYTSDNNRRAKLYWLLNKVVERNYEKSRR